MTGSLLFGVVQAIPSASATTSGTDATAYGMNPAHTGVSNDPVGPDWTPLWSAPETGWIGYPVITSGEVIALINSTSPALTAFDARNGAVDWSKAVGSPALGITYQSGRVFEQSGATLSAYDIATGNQDWSIAIPNGSAPFFSAAPTAANGIVYTVGYAGDSLYAFNQTDGSLLWTDSVYTGQISSPAVDANTVYGSFECDDTYAFNATTGHSIWFAPGPCDGQTGQTPVLADGHLLLRDQVLDAASGKTVRSFSSGPTPAVDGPFDYAEDGGTLRAETVAGGHTLWQTTGDGGLDSAPIEVNGVVYEGSSKGHVYGYSAATGQQLTNLNVGIAIQPPPPGNVDSDSWWGLSEGDDLLAVPAGDTLFVYGGSGASPGAPANVTAVAGNTQATVGWTVPADNGSAITDFTVTPTAGGVSQTPFVVAASTIGSATDPTPGASDQTTVTGLTNGTSYTFTVTADNAGGAGSTSAATLQVTPSGGSSSPPPLPGTDATAFGMNPAHTGVSTDPVGPNWTEKWSTTQAGWVGYPVIAGGQVIALTNGPSSSLTAFNATTGAIDWSDSVGGTDLGMTYQSGRVFVQSGGLLTAYDAATGAVDWSAVASPGGFESAAPTAANGLVYIDSQGLRAVDQTDGASVWFGSGGGDTSSPAVDANGVYASYGCDQTFALNPESGATLWTYTNGCTGGGGQTAVLADNGLFLRDQILDANAGKTARAFNSGPAPAVDGQYDYAEYQGTLRAETVDTGQMRWSTTGDGGLDTSPIQVDGVVYEGSSTGHVYGYSAVTGQQLVDLNVGTPVQVPASLVNQQIDSSWDLAEGDGLLAIPAGDTLTVYGDSGTPPAAPTGVTATAGDAQATVDWTVPAANGGAITDFTVTPNAGGVAQTPFVLAAGSDGSATDPSPGASDQAIVPGLTNGTSYTFTVMADNADGGGVASAPTSAVTPAGPPLSPTSVVAYAGQQTALLNWTVGGNNGAPITGFVITTYQNGSAIASQTVAAGATGSALDPTPGAADSYLVQGLTGGTPVTFTVAGVNSTGSGTPSGPVAQVTPTSGPNLPFPPTGPSASVTGQSGQATISWTVPAANGAAITSFQIVPVLNGALQSPVTAIAGNVGSNLDPTPGAADSYAISNLYGNQYGGNYTFIVAATNSVGTGPESTQTNALTLVPLMPGTPSNVSAASPGPGQATISWTVPASNGAAITRFQITPILNGTAQAAVSVTAGNVGSNLDPTPGAADSYTISNLYGGTYTFTLAATNSVGTSPASTPTDALTLIPLKPGTPSNVSAASPGPGQATVSWTAPASNGAAITAFYITPMLNGSAQPAIWLSSEGVGTNLDPTPGAADSWTIDTLSGGSYTFTVSAANSVGNSGESSPSSSVAVAIPPPTETEGVVANSPRPNTALVSWTVPLDFGPPITSFVITAWYGGSTPSQTVVRAGAPGSSLSPTPDDADSYTLTGLAAGDYTFTVAAINSAGTGPTSHQSSNIIVADPGRLVASPSTVSFGNISLGDISAAKTVTLTNTGGSSLTITGFALGTDAYDFLGQTDCSTLAPGQSCSVAMSFLPGAVGLRKMTLKPIAGPISVPTVLLEGTGTEGYYIVTANGAVHAFGDARWHGDLSRTTLMAPIVTVASTGDGGYWLVGSNGSVNAYGDALSFGSLAGRHLNKPIEGMAPTFDDGGYWMVASDGGIFTFGDARFYGSTGAVNLHKPIVGMTVTPDGRGYWLVASDGGIFTFGDARFYGSTGAVNLHNPIIGMAATPDGRGYWLIASDGGIFAFGDAHFYGSTGGGAVQNAVGMALSGGYTLQAFERLPA